MSRTLRGDGKAVPPYPLVHSGPCLVAGSAFCLHDDLARAWEVFPGAPVIAVNGAAREVKALALYTCHPERFVQYGYDWIKHQRRLFGDGFTVHSGLNLSAANRHVQHWWEDVRGPGGSAWGARKLAWLMGFGPVVLVGCPLVRGNYTGHRPGRIMTKLSVVEGFCRSIEADTEWHEGAFSMSGRTAEILSSPC